MLMMLHIFNIPVFNTHTHIYGYVGGSVYKHTHYSGPNIFSSQTIFRNPKEVKPYSVSSPERCNLPASAIRASSDSLVVVDMEAPAAHIAQHKWQPNTPDGQGTPFLFQHAKAAASTSGGTFMRIFKGPSGSSGSEDRHYPQALAYPAQGIRSSSIVSITYDNEVITGNFLLQILLYIVLFVNRIDVLPPRNISNGFEGCQKSISGAYNLFKLL